MDDNLPFDEDNKNVDFLMPESGPGQEAANFSAAQQRKEFLGTASPEKPPEKPAEVKPEQPQAQQKESEWPMGVRKSVEVNGKKWEYLEYGNPDGQSMLNVHGWLGSSAEGQDRLSRAFAGEVIGSPGMKTLESYKDPENPEKNYSKVAGRIAEGVREMQGKYRVIAPELPGFGKTEALSNITLNAMADELAAFEKAVGMENVVAFGSSMGGILAAKLAARHPEAVRTIVLQGTMTQPEDMNRVPYIAAQIATLRPISYLLEKTGLSKKLFASIVKGSKDFKIADARTASLTLREIGKNIEEDINKVKCPVVVIDGAKAYLVPIMNSAKAAVRFHPEIPEGELVAKKKVVFLPVGGRAGEQGHNIVNTAPEFVAALVDSVVSKL